ncbi:MAG: hypothetical protein FWB85_08610 [Chitinispirillia bacterium]|nr:hypothetical protein [Chitinispirillia bacterium]
MSDLPQQLVNRFHCLVIRTHKHVLYDCVYPVRAGETPQRREFRLPGGFRQAPRPMFAAALFEGVYVDWVRWQAGKSAILRSGPSTGRIRGG